MTTKRLDRVSGVNHDGSGWSVVAKTLRPASASPAFAFVPPEHHKDVLEELRWLDEADVYGSALGSHLPPPLRTPVIHLIEYHPDGQQVTIWMEDVDDLPSWDNARYRRTAEALGALCATATSSADAERFALRPREISRLFFGKIVHHDLAIQRSDEFWAMPEIAAVIDAEHRSRLFDLADALPRLLERLTSVPRGLCHGDATPDNFREPASGDVVALDWSYAHVGEIGSDLAQLLVGRFESGSQDAGDIEETAGVLLDGFHAGLERTGMIVDPNLVEIAWATHLAVRFVFSALLLDHRPDLATDERISLLRQRLSVARFGIDLAAGANAHHSE